MALARVQEVDPWTTTRHETPRKLASRPHEWRAIGPEGVGFSGQSDRAQRIGCYVHPSCFRLTSSFQIFVM